MVKTSELPSELEYISDWGAQDNFRQTFRVHLNRALILQINDPDGSFEIALAGLDTLLDYYKDTTYLEDLDSIAYKHKHDLEGLKVAKARGKSIIASKINMRFTYNNARFRALMRLAGRASFLPFPPVAVAVGGKNRDLHLSDEELTGDESEEIALIVDKNLENTLELTEQSVDELKSSKIKEEKEEIKK